MGDSGSAQLLRLGVESTWGTKPAGPNGIRIPLSGECTFEFAQTRSEVLALGLNDWSPRRPVLQRSQCGGDVPFYLDPLATAFLLADLFGAPTTTGTHAEVNWQANHAYTNEFVQPTVKNGYVYQCTTPGTSHATDEPTWPTTLNATVTDGTVTWTCHAQQSFQHVFKLGAPIVGASFETGDTAAALYNVFTGMRCTKSGWKIGDVGAIEVVNSYVGKQDSTAITSEDGTPTTYAHVPFDMASANLSVKYGGSAVTTLNSLSFDVERQVSGQSFPIGSLGIPGKTALKKGPIKGTAVFEFDAWTRYTAAKAGTETSFEVAVQHGTGDGTTGNEKVTILLPEVVLEPKSARQVTDGLATQEFPFWAYYGDDANASAIVVTLKNTIAVIA